jgi:hypothetical protein
MLVQTRAFQLTPLCRKTQVTPDESTHHFEKIIDNDSHRLIDTHKVTK